MSDIITVCVCVCVFCKQSLLQSILDALTCARYHVLSCMYPAAIMMNFFLCWMEPESRLFEMGEHTQ